MKRFDKTTLEGNEARLNHGERVRLKEEDVSKEYWMIEKSIDGQAHWWIPDHSESTHWDDPCRWTTDSSKAKHYDCKAAAQYVMGDQMPCCFVTGHIDCDGPDMALPFGD